MQREHSFKKKLQIAICSYLQAWPFAFGMTEKQIKIALKFTPITRIPRLNSNYFSFPLRVRVHRRGSTVVMNKYV